MPKEKRLMVDASHAGHQRFSLQVVSADGVRQLTGLDSGGTSEGKIRVTIFGNTSVFRAVPPVTLTKLGRKQSGMFDEPVISAVHISFPEDAETLVNVKTNKIS